MPHPIALCPTLFLLVFSGLASAASAPAASGLVPVVDTHIDAPSLLLEEWRDLDVASPGREFDYASARTGGLAVAFMSIYTSADEDDAGKARQVANLQIDSIEALAARHPDKFALLHSPADVGPLPTAGRVFLALGMENGAPLGDDLAQVAKFQARGVRYITLAHSRTNRISDSSYDPNRPWHGLSPFGEKVVAEMNRLGVMVDVSHLSDEAVTDAIRVSRAPVIASHSGFRHLTPGLERNLSDALAQAIAKSGGVVQVPFGIPFVNRKASDDLQAQFVAKSALASRNAKAKAANQPLEDVDAFDAAWKAAHPMPPTPIDAVLDQIDYGVKLLGADHIGIGSDFDGMDGNLPAGLRTVADYPNLVAGLRARGYNEQQIAGIMGGNLLRIWQRVEMVGRR